MAGDTRRRAYLLKALAHPSRLEMIDLLAQGERCVTDLQAAVGDHLTTVSKHLAVLRNAGLVETRKEGLYVYYRLKAPCLRPLLDCMEAAAALSTPRAAPPRAAPQAAPPPRAVRVSRPVTIALIGGFLGAGKTTAIGALAVELIQRGKRVAVLTNDQAAGLVDTVMAERLGVPVEEVAGGCFCCRFEDMLDAVLRILPSEPDILLCEPVGSCTDMAATVLNPLKAFYPEAFTLAPFTVMADPRRVREAVLAEAPEPFGPEVGYVFRKQLEEADALMLSKADTLADAEADRLTALLRERYARPVLRCSALTDEGIAAWADRILSGAPSGAHVLSDIDYDTYARGEALLGWLNATARVTTQAGCDGAGLLGDLLERIRAACAERGAEIAHLKAALDGPGLFCRANATSTAGRPGVAPDAAPLPPGAEAQLILNARIGIDPEALRGLALQALTDAAEAAGAGVAVETLRAFQPGYPTPPYRMEA